jgi:2'-5' RNA ligase
VSPEGRIRAFVALEIEAALQQRIEALVASLRSKVTGVRWTAAEGIHLTLRFLGPSLPATLEALKPRLRELAAACPRGEAAVGPLGMFPERGAPRVLWLGLALPPGIAELQSGCEAAAVAAGYEPEGRPFTAHLTLGRWKDRSPRPTLPEADLGTTALEHLVLFRSDLRPSGAVYTPLDVFPLGSPPICV